MYLVTKNVFQMDFFLKKKDPTPNSQFLCFSKKTKCISNLQQTQNFQKMLS